MLKCPACSFEVADAAAVRCSHCGAALFEAETRPATEPGLPLSQFGPLGDARFAPGRIFASRYRIVSLLGRGGMGEVYRAEDLKLGQLVAVKLLSFHPRGRDDHLKQFAAEVRLARGIAHPNVCRVYDIGAAEGWQYLSMEYVDGETLASLLRRIGRLPADKVLDFARQLFAGVAAAHDHGVLHRDLKPSNIMVDGRGRIRVMDFGLAISTGEAIPRDRAGTPAYMAPEQLVGDRVSERTDLYALGLIVYELYTGRAVFEGQTFYQRLHQPRSRQPPADEVDPRVAAIVARCLEEDPAARPSTAATVAAMLPGGDPLTAAVSERRFVSPEMVAAANRMGTLSLPIAWLLLAMVTVGALVVAAQAEVMLVPHSVLPKPPAVLAERCAEILAHFGYTAPPLDRDFWFAPSADRTKLYFVYRQSPLPLIARNLFRVVGETDPPTVVPGMTMVKTDASGRLVGFTRVSDSARRSGDAGDFPNWSVFFAEAGLDEQQFVDVELVSPPLVPHDSARAWAAQTAGSQPVRVTAATLGGHAVHFEIGGAAAISMRDRTAVTTGRPVLAEQIFWVFIVSAFLATGIMARRNLRAGEGDRSNARKIGIFIACGGTISAMLRAHHVPLVVEEAALLLGVVGWSLVWAGFSWLAYISFEPYVRRLWPRTLVSWTRLLAGRLRDPLVGRDVLAGTLIGIALAGMLVVRFTVVPSSVPEPFADPAIEGLASTRLLGWSLIFALLDGLQFALGALFFVVLLRTVVRRGWIAIVVLSVLAAPIAPGGATGIAGWAWAIATGMIVMATVTRIGLLAGAIAVICLRSLTYTALTLNPESWYFGSSVVIVLLVIALATYGFIVSLAGVPALGIKK